MLAVNNITISIPVFERYEYFEDAINSSINQTVSCQVIVVDNCSSHSKFEDFVNKLNNPNVKYFRNEVNLGAIGNWNKCIENATTPWVSILHSDDMLSKYYIETIVKAIEKYPEENVFLVTDETAENPNLIFEPPGELSFNEDLKPKMFLLGNYAGFPGNIFNKNKVKVQFKNLNGASDFEFWYQLAKIKPSKCLRNILAFYRTSATQDSATMDIEEVVIKPVYLVRKNIIGFGNIFIKWLSMCELFDLYRYYQSLYNRNEEDNFQLSIPELNTYFKFFNKKGSRVFLHPVYKVIRFLLKKF